jgi:quinol monooxygenase YgiN
MTPEPSSLSSGDERVKAEPPGIWWRMANLDVVAVITAKSGSEAIVEAALTELAGASRGDHGCISYDLFASGSTPGAFVTIEKWESQADLDAHMASPHIAEMITVAGDHLDGFPSIHTLRLVES